jgi:uncharacterized protein YecT (DUF1311 family)
MHGQGASPVNHQGARHRSQSRRPRIWSRLDHPNQQKSTSIQGSEKMRMHSSLVLLCVIAASGCGRLSATNQGAPSAATGSSGKSAKVGAPVPADNSLLRGSYYDCARSSDGSTWSIQSCIENEFVYQDARLNSVYRNLRSKLPDAERLGLRNDERRWLSDKEGACKWDETREGQAQRINANICSLKKTADRAAQLEKELFRLSQP